MLVWISFLGSFPICPMLLFPLIPDRCFSSAGVSEWCIWSRKVGLEESLFDDFTYRGVGEDKGAELFGFHALFDGDAGNNDQFGGRIA